MFQSGSNRITFLYGNSLLARDYLKQVQKPDLKSLTYCGYKCTLECTLYRATIENNNEMKKKAFEEFKWNEKFGVDFDADKVFCFGYKPKG